MKNWALYKEEDRGAIPNKIWVTDGENLALYKPDTIKNESTIEYESYKIALALGIPCAKTEKISLFGSEGCLSYNFKKSDPTIAYSPAANIYEKYYKKSDPAAAYLPAAKIRADSNDEITFNSKDSDSIPHKRLKVNFEMVREKIPAIERNVVDMLFVDCLIGNTDRHGYNWELIKDAKSNEVIGMAPLFDHGLSMWNNFSLETSALAWSADEPVLEHYEIFGRLSKDYSEQIKSLMTKCSTVELNEFVKPRYLLMQDIFEITQRSPEQLIENLKSLEDKFTQLEHQKLLGEPTVKQSTAAIQETKNTILSLEKHKSNISECDMKIEKLENKLDGLGLFSRRAKNQLAENILDAKETRRNDVSKLNEEYGIMPEEIDGHIRSLNNKLDSLLADKSVLMSNQSSIHKQQMDIKNQFERVFQALPYHPEKEKIDEVVADILNGATHEWRNELMQSAALKISDTYISSQNDNQKSKKPSYEDR